MDFFFFKSKTTVKDIGRPVEENSQDYNHTRGKKTNTNRYNAFKFTRKHF